METTRLKPLLNEQLGLLGLDYQVVSAKKSKLEVFDGEARKKVTDFICGYGSCLFGHNHPKIKQALLKALDRNTPTFVQLSQRKEAEKLAVLLDDLAFYETGKRFNVILSNTGTEAVETAIKHLLLQYQDRLQQFLARGKAVFSKYILNQDASDRKHIQDLSDAWAEQIIRMAGEDQTFFIVQKNSYHGQTLGSLSLTSNNKFRTGFERLLLNCIFIDPSRPDSARLSKSLVTELPFPDITPEGDLMEINMPWNLGVGLFAEPILGEGGVIPHTALSIKNIYEIADNFHLPIVWDEIQTGSYRTGRLFASSRYEGNGDYYILGKALGGGLAKISALLVDRNCYNPKFDLMHMSTFSEDEISSIIAQEFLMLANNEKDKINLLAASIKKELKHIARRCDQVIREVRCEGLLIGIEFKSLNLSGSYLLQGISRSGYFNYFAAAWFYHNYNIRLSAPLSNEFS
ncbi:MAG: aminotransferase class III-fold pyridoxal phosphate-dependent enzyme, partial [Cyclobacteriaceae bacterium]